MKKTLSVLLAVVMLLSMVSTAFAVENTERKILVSIDPETNITVVIPKSLESDVTAAEIDELIRNQDFNDGDVVTIIDAGYVNNEETVQPQTSRERVETTLTEGKEYEAQDYFVISVAKGQTTRLTSKLSKTLTVNFSSGDNPYISAEIGGSLTAEYSVEQEFSGPPESGTANSREYRVQFYAKTVRWVQNKYDNYDNSLIGRKSGTAHVPTKYLLYATDYIVK